MTPWNQAQKFARKKLREKLPETPTIDDPARTRIEGIFNGTVQMLGLLDLHAWMFVYTDDLFEVADNFSNEPDSLMRRCLGMSKLARIKSSGGLFFVAVWTEEKRLVAVSSYRVHQGQIYAYQADKLLSATDWANLTEPVREEV